MRKRPNSHEFGYEHPLGARAYQDFHESLKNTLHTAASVSGHVHGQTKHPADFCISTHDGLTLRTLPTCATGDVVWPTAERGWRLEAGGRKMNNVDFCLPSPLPRFVLMQLEAEN